MAEANIAELAAKREKAIVKTIPLVLIHFKFTFVYSVTKSSNFILLHVFVPFPSTSYGRGSLSFVIPLYILALLV